jgi:hypothetical protein
MEPIYATRTRDTRGGQTQVEYGPPVGYRFDNGKSQYVNFDASGTYQNTQTRESGGFANFALSVLSIAYPPAAPFIQAYNAVKAIDEGNVLGFVISAVGAGKSIPGLDKSTISMLNDVATGAKIVQAIDSKDPLKLLSATANIPNVDPDLKDLSIVLNTAKSLSDGNISGAFNGISKMSDRDSIGRLTDRFNDIVNGSDVAAIDPSQVAAFNPVTDENIDDTLTNAGLVRNDVIDDTDQEQEDREQAAREVIRDSEKTIEEQLADSGLVTDTQDQAIQEAERIAQEDREQAARDAVRASEKTIEDQLADSGLVPKTDDEKKLEGVEVTGKTITDTDLPITDDQGRNRVTDSILPVNPNVGETNPTLNKVEVTGKAITDTELPITTDSGQNRVTDSILPVNPNVGTTDPTLAPVTVTGKKIDNELTPDDVTLDPVTITGKREIEQELDPVTITGKREIEQELDPVTIIGKREIEQELDPVTIIGKKEEPALTTQPVITLPNITLPKLTDDKKTDTKKTTTPEEQFYQTTTQSNPTTPTDIKYFLDMIGSNILPPTNKHDPVESLVNPPMSLEELLHHLRS